jgi:hypothetical protein
MAKHNLAGAAVLIGVFVSFVAGCGGTESRVDPKPFESAIARYLERNNMAMKVKQIKEGPTVDGQTATLVASLTHAELEGPSVTWTFTFEKNAEGTWTAVSHER